MPREIARQIDEEKKGVIDTETNTEKKGRLNEMEIHKVMKIDGQKYRAK